jgi:hypothetical protein
MCCISKVGNCLTKEVLTQIVIPNAQVIAANGALHTGFIQIDVVGGKTGDIAEIVQIFGQTDKIGIFDDMYLFLYSVTTGVTAPVLGTAFNPIGTVNPDAILHISSLGSNNVIGTREYIDLGVGNQLNQLIELSSFKVIYGVFIDSVGYTADADYDIDFDVYIRNHA